MSLNCSAVRSDPQAQASYCANSNLTDCCGICPNTDLAGIGVRLAFYLQSVMNVIVVFVSPEDSTASAWGATIMSIALIVPAMIQKKQGQLSLHHATLALNYSSLSTLISLAISPMCTIWHPKVPPQQEISDSRNQQNTNRGPPRADEKDYKMTADDLEKRWGRTILAAALLLQVRLSVFSILLLTHPIFLIDLLAVDLGLYPFPDPRYSQTPCNADTNIVLFFGVITTAYHINRDKYSIWPAWLLFSLSTTAIWGAILVHNIHKSNSPGEAAKKNLRLRLRNWGSSLGHLFALFFAVMYVGVAEKQIRANDILVGENEISSFGSVAALLLAVAPSWTVASSLRRKFKPGWEKPNKGWRTALIEVCRATFGRMTVWWEDKRKCN
ncbi:hypothetical protein BOTBODRAFT_45100 [Botryobasidium botryosum FD-172 SS1]|uniref:Uncharacterized protein n=1 Tax=Botryobasidium botryosum (strain FD-172 SS1) TaxID=930990 RepID=A0A067MG26_BOTB1|nr:hypothetical protein BOTBODRAFT_45100 [Botryobasidium botryosum FD-172 SS1]